MPINSFNTESKIPEIAAGTAAAQKESEDFTSFLRAASEIPGVEVLSMTASLFTPERAAKNDLSL